MGSAASLGVELVSTRTRKKKGAPRLAAVDLGAYVDTFGTDRPRPDGAVVKLEATGTAGGAWRAKICNVVDQLRDAGDIKAHHHQAANDFAIDYQRCRLMARYAKGGLERIDKPTGADTIDIDFRASERVHRAMDAMGKIGSAAVIGIVCEGESLTAHAGRSIQNDRKVIKGILILALDVLARTYRT